ncbi:hypothetical protein LptCag_2604 [Leptospirillum ferriphilum]|uniref:Uncharacterized protein n=1 Tax=Leptospirillum ferriphilum TaxID=178606 RepID=A0A094WF58_9BACT|nr:hypothetical protein LptCag_2604 [Leptospirillum ferriphilum]
MLQTNSFKTFKTPCRELLRRERLSADNDLPSFRCQEREVRDRA